MNARTAPRAAAHPFPALVGYTLRACLPAKRWWGVLLPCLGAVLFGWMATRFPDPPDVAFGSVARAGIFALVVPITCLVIGDAVLGADVRAGTFALTWLSPVPFRTIVLGRWLGGWLIALATIVPATALATVAAGVPRTAGAMALATASGSAAYMGLFLLIGVVTRRSTVWGLVVVFLGERMLGGALSAIAQISPLWETEQVYVGLAAEPGMAELLRPGTPSGWEAVGRLAVIAVVTLVVATWRMRSLSPVGADD